MKNWGPISRRRPSMLHGGDYNPEQWLHMPGVLAEDVRLMKLAGCNAMNVGIFAWAALEPEEGRYELGWLDGVLDRLHSADVSVVLATPSGARPAWLAQRYPEVLRVRADGGRNLFGVRHNHCPTSPIYRRKVAEIDGVLAERYGKHPAVLLWHLSNEYGGSCHCELCQAAFRGWLERRYRDLDTLNKAWWTSFWSHTYTDWSQIHSPTPIGDTSVHCQNLDWKRFVTEQTVDFMRAEIAPLKRASPELPVTTNLMGTYDGLDYFKLARDLDVVSWDSYPSWHGRGVIPSPRGSWDEQGRDWKLAADVAFVHDLTRSLKGGRPFMLMESTPSVTNWQSVSKLKRPGMHLLSSLQAVAHGSDTVQYFQFRKSRGSAEKLHGAVVDHAGHENTRVFREVSEVGQVLARLGEVVGTSVPAKVAIIFDWENRWALEDAQGPLNDGRKAYERSCKAHYESFWKRGIAVDVVNEDADFGGYRLVVAPMLYMVREGVGERLERFVRSGGTLLATYWSGVVDQSDLCFLGGFPGPLRVTLGIWAEEIDALYPEESRALVMSRGNAVGMEGRYEVRDLCELVHAEGAEVLGTYADDFYAGRPAFTMNRLGAGKAYYLAARAEQRFLDELASRLERELELERAVARDLPEGVSACIRADGRNRFLFLMNFTPRRADVSVEGNWSDALTGKRVGKSVTLEAWGAVVCRAETGGATGGG